VTKPSPPAFDPDRFGLRDAVPEVAPVARRSRGRGLAVLSLAAAAIVAALLGTTAYLALDAVQVVSFDPLGRAWGWILAFGIAAAAAVGVLVLALVALVWCRPRRVAGLALAASLVLPVLAVALAGTVGFAVAKQHAAADLTADGGLVDSAADVVQSWNVDVGPFRGLLKGLVEAVA
jgi:MFS family permease